MVKIGSVMRRASEQIVSVGYGAVLTLRNLSVAVLASMGMVHADTVTIAALGDSLTAGYGLPQEHGLVPQLETWLQTRGADVAIVNAGVSGDTTAGGLSRVDWTLTPDIDAMIVTLGGNDYLRGLDPAVSRQNLDGILARGQAADVEMLLVGLQVGANYGQDYKTEFETMYADLSAKYGIALYPDFGAGLRAAAGTDGGISEFMQADGIHPNKDGVTAIVEAMGPAVLDLIAAVD
ncbi:MAG: arylesterase [Pseudomonadota bacterium]